MSPRHLAVLLPLLLLLLAACRQEPASVDDPVAPAAGDTAAAGEMAATDGAAAPGGDVPRRPDVPALQVATIDGGSYDLAAHRGEWVVVNFWATWCSPCLKEMPELSALHSLRDHISVVGLAYEEIEVPAMQSFLTEHPVSYPVAIIDVYDPPEDFDTPRGLPMTYLIAPDGTVARQFLGPVTASEIETAIAAGGGPSLESLSSASGGA